MKKTSILLICFLGLILVFSFKSHNTPKSGITNYYYFQGEKWYYDTRTDMVFVKFSPNFNPSQMSPALSLYPEIDIANIHIEEGNSFVPLKSKLSEVAVSSLVERMKDNNIF